MLDEKTGMDMSEKGPFAAMTLTDLVKNHAADWCGDADCRKLIAQSLDDALDMMTQRQGADMAQWRWGRENVAQLTHKFYSHIPVLKNISDLSVESSGDFYTIDRGGGFDNPPEKPFARTHGGGFRGVYDLANPDASLFMISTGESDHLFSGHYGDLVNQWVNVKGITLSGSADDFQKKNADDLVLTP
jgi:penicillin amidase